MSARLSEQLKKSEIFLLKIFSLAVFWCFLALFAALSLLEIFVWLFFAASLLFRWDGRIAIGCALALLLACPFLLMWKTQTLAGAVAEIAAIYAYYFLVIGVVLQLVEYRRERKSDGIMKDKP